MMLLELPLSTRILLTKQFSTKSDTPERHDGELGPSLITRSCRGGDAGLVSVDFMGVSLLRSPPSYDHGHGGTHTRGRHRHPLRSLEWTAHVHAPVPAALVFRGFLGGPLVSITSVLPGCLFLLSPSTACDVFLPFYMGSGSG
ncbi:hypothetical protein F2Q70_00005564 [Brassica cretica]|uniref:Uncharacterized protein n=2 Tax=Brassica cretica TaxID=69181 RepID=A0A8S9G2Q5_BRACR|nr:hypothetical protein F2Q68_00022145 [Brassica cretica]KAF2573764.1 hypothetical protein F2Q70_00005564 [Brassica cretica]KAF3567371.1 hypothetical protein DY000_02018070 [Brassica cretica]